MLNLPNGVELATRLMLATMTFGSFGIYLALNRTNRKNCSVLNSRWDDAIPFLPIFSVPYLLYLPYLVLTLTYGIVFTSDYAEVAGSILAVQLLAAVIFSIRQTHVPRPPLSGSGIVKAMAAFIYRHDRPYCTFPSLHVACCLLCGYWSSMFFPSWTPLFVMLTTAVIASTLFMKQHVVADVLAGAALSLIALAIFR